jgi:hypothetical protein
LKIRRVTFGAVGIPGLVRTGPVQRIARGIVLIGIEVEPAFLQRVPGDAQRLEPAAWKLDQILLQRLDAECIGDLEIRVLTVFALGVDEIFAGFFEEPGFHACMDEANIVEIAPHGLLGSAAHGLLMMRARPGVELRAMTFAANLVVGKPGRELTLGAAPRRQRGRREEHQSGDRQNFLQEI